MKYKVNIKKKVNKNLLKLPKEVKQMFLLLIEDLKEKGPVQETWKNYSKLQKNNYHCHLGYRHVACWKKENKNITIEVYYVGSREKSPY